MTTTSSKFKYNGTTHVALLVAKSLRGWFSTKMLRDVSNKFNDTKKTSQSLNLLKRHGFLVKKDDLWRITPEGVRYVYFTARYNAMANTED